MDEYLAEGTCDGPGPYDTMLYANGDIKAHGKCINSQMVGYWKSYYRNGEPKAEGILKDHKPYGEWSFYYENGQKKASGSFVQVEAGLGCGGAYRGVYFEGRWKFWDAEGRPTERVTFRDGAVTGAYARYYPDATLLCTGLYFNNSLNGIWAYYHPNGQKKSQEYYRYDEELQGAVPRGTWREWDTEGKLMKVVDHSSP